MRTTSIATVPDSALTADNDSRLVVAAGGGGAGTCANNGFGVPAGGGSAGDSNVTGAGDGGKNDCDQGGSGGFGGSSGGSVGGDRGVGGDALAGDFNGSGAGGGGYWGGGGSSASNAAGGAGSSFWIDGATATSMNGDTNGTPSVTITPVFPPFGFELDGNAVQDLGVPTLYDWSNLFGAGATLQPDFNPLAAPAFATDPFDTLNDDIFEGGGSKDVCGIQGSPPSPCGGGHWLWTNSKPQPKNDLEHLFAGMFVVPSGHAAAGDRVLVAGTDRYDNAGDTTLGFWLLQDPQIGESLIPSGGGFLFTGVHRHGDLFFVMDFTVGGSVSNPLIFRWTGDDATGQLVPQPTTAGPCGPAISSDLRCARVNGGSIAVPWTYVDKSGNTSPAAGEFAELGIDLTGVLGASNVPCFSEVLAETRSSQSPTATLSDFVIASPFVTCDTPAIATNADPGGSSVTPGASQHDAASVTAADTSTPVTGTLTFFLCGPGASTVNGCPVGRGTQVGDPVAIAADGTATSDTVSGSDTSTSGRYCWRAEYTPDSAADHSHLRSSETNGTTECFTVPDTTPPDITVSVDPADQLAGSGWYNIASSGTDGVLVHVSATDQTAVTNITCKDGSAEVLNISIASGSFTLLDGQHSISCTASDGINTGAGPSSTAMPVEIDVDQTAPTLNPSVSPSPLYLHAAGATASPGASDTTSGVASSSCDPVTTSTAGDHTVACTATDNAGNSSNTTIHYTVEYLILGFFSPAPGSKWKTGQTVPVKIALADVNGVRISDSEAAGLLSPTCRVKFSASGAQTLNPTCMKYDPAMDQFIYNWKLGSQTGSETIKVTVSYANTNTTTTKSEPPITIIK